MGTREESSVVNCGVLAVGAGFDVVDCGGVGGLVAGFSGGLVVIGFGTNLVVGLGVGHIVGFGVGRSVGLGAGLAVIIAGICGGLRGCLVPLMSGILLVIPLLPFGSVVLPLNILYGRDGSIITLGIAEKRVKMGEQLVFEYLSAQTKMLQYHMNICRVFVEISSFCLVFHS